jgi:TerD domain
VDLPRLPVHVDQIVFTVNSFAGQTFAEVQNAFCRLMDENTGQELARYTLSGGGPLHRSDHGQGPPLRRHLEHVRHRGTGQRPHLPRPAARQRVAPLALSADTRPPSGCFCRHAMFGISEIAVQSGAGASNLLVRPLLVVVFSGTFQGLSALSEGLFRDNPPCRRGRP